VVPVKKELLLRVGLLEDGVRTDRTGIDDRVREVVAVRPEGVVTAERTDPDVRVLLLDGA